VSRIRVLIAHHGVMGHSLRMALEGETEIVGEAGDAEQAILQAKRVAPDVCLVGWDIAGEGLNAVQGILAVAPDASVVVLSETSDVDDLLAVVRAGAVGYLPGSLDEEQLLRVVRGVAANEAAVPRAMVRELIRELRTATALGGLTEREAQVLGMLRRGHSTAEIAARLQISPVTVRRHISELVRKFGVAGREELLSLDPKPTETVSDPTASEREHFATIGQPPPSAHPEARSRAVRYPRQASPLRTA
jgi:DNA-binding NarL/FixJ family response regulator